MNNLSSITATKIRDLNYFKFDDSLLVFAVDSDGAVGCMDKDESYRTPYVAGKMYPKVVLMEMLAIGGEVIAIYNDFCYEEDERNKIICDSISELVESLDISPKIIHNCFNSYKNPQSTAYGITLVGVINEDSLKVGVSKEDDIVCVFSKPSTRMELETQVTPAEVKKLRQTDFVHEILPCGSHGFRSEANRLAENSGLIFVEDKNHELHGEADMSCGAAGVIVVSLSRKDLDKLKALNIQKAFTIIGHLEKGNNKKIDINYKKSNYVLKENGDILINDSYLISSKTYLEYGKGLKEW